MVRLAQSEPGVPVRLEELDTDPWRLNVPNGTLDLRTGALHPARPADLLTKLAGVAYDPTAPCPQWERFLGTVLNQDADLIRFLQKALGYTLTGDTREQCLFLLYGTGANGKSTLLTTVRKVCGDYARQTPTETLLLKRGDAIGNDVARLCGARFVVAVEAEGGRRLAEVLVKQLTGGDTVAVRYLYQEAFEYAPTFKLFLAVNHKPVVQGTDNAIWRRMRLIPFAVTIPIEAQDRELGDKLQTELPGILRWMVEGCLAWQREGLGIPQAVQSATEGYRGEQDVLAQFLTERCSLGQGEQVKSSDLYAEYAGWCAQAGESRLSPRELASRLQEGGYTKHRYKDGNMWRGLTLKKDEE
jgi:putative DNA primase/helicase